MSADDPIAWYAVGCYDLLLRRHAQARRFFSKATSLKPNLVTALIAFGHTFAEKDEHEQVSSPQFFFVGNERFLPKALAAYRHASELMQGSHIPHLCIAMELIRKEKKANLKGELCVTHCGGMGFEMEVYHSKQTSSLPLLSSAHILFSHFFHFFPLPSEARQVLLIARELYTGDPVLHNEMGVVAYMQNDAHSAWRHFLTAADLISGGGVRREREG